MIRFIIRSAFLLGLVALFLPSGQNDGDDAATGIDPFTAMMGAQAAIADIWGFCDRAPAACSAGGDLVQFAGDRIGDGFALAYRTIQGRAGEPATTDIAAVKTPAPQHPVPANAIPASSRPDDIVTGAVAQVLELARPATPGRTAKPAATFAMPALEETRTVASQPRPDAAVPAAMTPARLPIPQPAPRA
ncbi:DUF5330 domain-containing protein [Aurantimonas coralicida]|uniref:DUF5330 domain-containing protein n=1 Tax=Aurantimonas coralicida TaxID=182270 RepID=UPI001E4024F1|nr:DUF5330 domain-containing protein [Aurantimonas coralicida]MCD1643074.1 DUF5330 domain-containing protein [Aurantimonas coralicida]